MSQDLTGVNHFHRRDVISISFSSCCRSAVLPTQITHPPPLPNLLLALPLLNVLSIWLRWLYQQGLFSPSALLHPPFYHRRAPCSRWISHPRIPPSAEEHHSGSSVSWRCYKSPKSGWNAPSWVLSDASGIRSVISFPLKDTLWQAR